MSSLSLVFIPLSLSFPRFIIFYILSSTSDRINVIFLSSYLSLLALLSFSLIVLSLLFLFLISSPVFYFICLFIWFFFLFSSRFIILSINVLSLLFLPILCPPPSSISFSSFLDPSFYSLFVYLFFPLTPLSLLFSLYHLFPLIPLSLLFALLIDSNAGLPSFTP